MVLVIKMENIKLKTGETVVYSTRGICKVTDITTQTIGRETKDYYVLTPVFDSRATYFIPVDYDSEKVHVKKALTRAEAKALLDFAKEAEPLEWIASPNERKQKYDWVYKAEAREKKVRLIKALRAHEQQQKARGKQLYAADSRILSGCESLVSGELAYVLGKTPDEILMMF